MFTAPLIIMFQREQLQAVVCSFQTVDTLTRTYSQLNRTALEKCTHLYDDTQRTIKNTSAFDTWSGVEEKQKIIKEEGSNLLSKEEIDKKLK